MAFPPRSFSRRHISNIVECCMRVRDSTFRLFLPCVHVLCFHFDRSHFKLFHLILLQFGLLRNQRNEMKLFFSRHFFSFCSLLQLKFQPISCVFFHSFHSKQTELSSLFSEHFVLIVVIGSHAVCVSVIAFHTKNRNRINSEYPRTHKHTSHTHQ